MKQLHKQKGQYTVQYIECIFQIYCYKTNFFSILYQEKH